MILNTENKKKKVTDVAQLRLPAKEIRKANI